MSRSFIRSICVSLFGLAVAGCYNPINSVTADRYRQNCASAQRAGFLDVAEEACRRALINARVGHLGPEVESQDLYNLARVKRQLRKFSEAEELYRESLGLQETLAPPDERRIGRRLAELAIVLGQQSRHQEAWPLLSRLMPIAGSYGGEERAMIKTVFEIFAQEYEKREMKPEALQLQDKAKTL